MDNAREIGTRPPDEISIEVTVHRHWKSIIEMWTKGWHAESAISRLENYIEGERERIFAGPDRGDGYDWKADWIAAAHFHDNQKDFVLNRRAHNEGLTAMWLEWQSRTYSAMANLSMEALRSMVLIDGAAILACLTLLSGQISKPNPAAVLSAKVMLFFSILSLVMMALGHILSFLRVNEVASRVRGTIVGHIRHRRLYAISRYVRRHLDRPMILANALIYGSIFVFAFSAFIAAIILIAGS